MKPTQILVFVASAAFIYLALAVGRSAFEDQADREFWNSLSGAGEEVAEMRAAEAEKLSGGSLPIERAMTAYGVKGRTGFDVLAVNGGQRMAPLAGWVNHPDFKERAAEAKAFMEAQAAAEAEAEAAAAEGEGEEAAESAPAQAAE